MVSVYSALLKSLTIFQTGCTIAFHLAIYRRTRCSTSLSTLGILCLFNLDILMSMWYYFIVVSISFSLITNDVVCLFICLFVIHLCSLVKYLFNLLHTFFFFALFILRLNCKSSPRILFTNLFPDIFFYNIYSQSPGFSFL